MWLVSRPNVRLVCVLVLDQLHTIVVWSSRTCSKLANALACSLSWGNCSGLGHLPWMPHISTVSHVAASLLVQQQMWCVWSSCQTCGNTKIMVSDCTVWPIDDWIWRSMLTLKHSRHLNENGMKAVLKSTSFLLQMCINLRTALELCLVISPEDQYWFSFSPFFNGEFQEHREEYKRNASACNSRCWQTQMRQHLGKQPAH